jgi:hypothetical protein
MKRTTSNNSINSQDRKRPTIGYSQDRNPLIMQRNNSSNSIGTVDNFNNEQVISDVARMPNHSSSDSMGTISVASGVSLSHETFAASDFPDTQIPNVINVTPDVNDILFYAIIFNPEHSAAPVRHREFVYNQNTDIISGQGDATNINVTNKEYCTEIQKYVRSYDNLKNTKERQEFTEGLTAYLIYNKEFRFVKKEKFPENITFLTQEEVRKKIMQSFANARNVKNPSNA